MTLPIAALLVLIPIAIGFLAVALTHSDQAIGRAEFFVRLFGLGTFGVALSFILRQRDENIAAAIMLLYLLVACYLVPYWAISRLRDMGVRRKYLAVLTDVPVIGWLYTLYLLCAKPANDLAKEEDDLPPIVPQDVVDAIEAEKSDHARGTAA